MIGQEVVPSNLPNHRYDRESETVDREIKYTLKIRVTLRKEQRSEYASESHTELRRSFSFKNIILPMTWKWLIASYPLQVCAKYNWSEFTYWACAYQNKVVSFIEAVAVYHWQDRQQLKRCSLIAVILWIDLGGLCSIISFLSFSSFPPIFPLTHSSFQCTYSSRTC